MQTTTQTCAFPGCDRPVAEPTAQTGRRPIYCDRDEHNRETAFRERQRLREVGLLPEVDPQDRPVTMAGASLAAAGEGLQARVAELRELAERIEQAASTGRRSARGRAGARCGARLA